MQKADGFHVVGDVVDGAENYLFSVWDPVDRVYPFKEWSTDPSMFSVVPESILIDGRTYTFILEAYRWYGGDDGYELYVNGNFIGGDNSWFTAETWDVYLDKGKNVIAIKGLNNDNGQNQSILVRPIVRFPSPCPFWTLSEVYGVRGSPEY